MAKAPQNTESNSNETISVQEAAALAAPSQEAESQNNEIAVDDTKSDSAQIETNASTDVAQEELESDIVDQQDDSAPVNETKDTSLDTVLDLIGELHDRVSTLETDKKIEEAKAANPIILNDDQVLKANLELANNTIIQLLGRLEDLERVARAAGLLEALPVPVETQDEPELVTE